jgi:hypothetical protein
MRSLTCALLLMLVAACATQPVSEIGEVTLERTTCFGLCPAYTVTIAPNGAVTYIGGRYTRISGERHARADHAAVVDLHHRILAADFFNLQDEYRTTVSDLPDYIVTVERGGITKRVLDYGGLAAAMPPAVRAIEEEIDGIAGTERWVGGAAAEAEQAPAPTARWRAH